MPLQTKPCDCNRWKFRPSPNPDCKLCHGTGCAVYVRENHCEVQWIIPATGYATPDDHKPIGLILPWYEEYQEGKPTGILKPDSQGRWYKICTEHLARTQDTKTWEFRPIGGAWRA